MEKRKLLSAAVSSALLCTSAHAVSLSPDGMGDVLIFPYYTVRNGFETYVSIVNPTPDLKVLRVRFNESLNGAPVLDFNLFLRSGDTWIGAVVDNGTGAKVVTSDTSCTTPSLRNNPGFGNFTSANYSGNEPTVGADIGPAGMDRTREGFLEVFEMGVVPSTLRVNNFPVLDLIKHNAQGVPVNCDAMQPVDLTDQLSAPTGGLYGLGYLVSPSAGLEFSYDAVALSDFARGANRGIWFPAGHKQPNYGDASPRESRVFAASVDATGKAGTSQLYVDSGWASGHEAVTAVLMASAIQNDYILEPSTASRSEWVTAMPTKRHFVFDDRSAVQAGSPATLKAPFTQSFPRRDVSTTPPPVGEACELFDYELFARGAQKVRSRGAAFGSCPGFSVCPGPFPENFRPKVCNQVSVSPFFPGEAMAASASITRPAASYAIGLPAGFQNGWYRADLTLAYTRFLGNASSYPPPTTRVLVGPTHNFYGLPVVGFLMQTFTRNNLVINGVPSTSGYGGNFVHRYERRIERRVP